VFAGREADEAALAEPVALNPNISVDEAPGSQLRVLTAAAVRYIQASWSANASVFLGRDHVTTDATNPVERRYQERLNRYVTAMRTGMPDRVPIRPFVAEFVAKYAGFTCQQVCHDYEKACLAARRCAADFDWDAVVCNMVYVWTGLAQALGLRYYGIPGIHVPANTGFQYREPSEEEAYMKPDEYDELIADPTGFLYNVWLPRVSEDIRGPGQRASYRHNLALVKGSMAMLQYFMALGDQNARLRSESGTVSAIAGILKAPFDIIADKLRGYIGLVMDMHTQPDKVLAACEALAPHLAHVALTTADPTKTVPVGYWMHRGCVPFINREQFHSHYWPTIKPIVEELWAHGHQTLFYAEGKWLPHLDSIMELPPGSIVYHVDQDDVFEVNRKLRGRFCLSGGIPNFLLSFGKPEQVRDYCRRVLQEVARESPYIMDAGAIMQDDTSIENVRVMTDTTLEYGVYSRGSGAPAAFANPGAAAAAVPSTRRIADFPRTRVPPGVCVPWEQKLKKLPELTGDVDMLRQIWNNIEGLGNTFIWQVLLSF
jgi:uroporphyrinogen-III decarboxylase